MYAPSTCAVCVGEHSTKGQGVTARQSVLAQTVLSIGESCHFHVWCMYVFDRKAVTVSTSNGLLSVVILCDLGFVTNEDLHG